MLQHLHFSKEDENFYLSHCADKQAIFKKDLEIQARMLKTLGGDLCSIAQECGALWRKELESFKQTVFTQHHIVH